MKFVDFKLSGEVRALAREFYSDDENRLLPVRKAHFSIGTNQHMKNKVDSFEFKSYTLPSRLGFQNFAC